MIRTITLLPLLAVWLSASPALSQGVPSKWAEVLFTSENTKLVHDFGTIARGAKAEHRFLLGNPFNEDVEIGSVDSSCGCTHPAKTKDLLKTYDTAEIVAELDTRNYSGFKEATVKVALGFRSRDPARGTVWADPPVQLKIRAFIRGDIVFEPGDVEFGSLPPGQPAEKRVTLLYAGLANWQIVEAVSPAKYLAVTVRETGRKPMVYASGAKATEVAYDVAVKLNETAPSGYFQEQVTLRTNDPNPQNARVPLVVQGYIVPSLSVTPTMLMLGEMKPGQSAAKNLVVRGAKPFRILDVTGPDAQFRFKPTSEAKEVQVVGVNFTAGNKPGRIAGKIHITTDMNSASVDVDVDGQIVAGEVAGPALDSGAAAPKSDGFRIEPAKPGGNVLRPLKRVEPDATPPAGPK